jgi:hypothetical protein
VEARKGLVTMGVKRMYLLTRREYVQYLIVALRNVVGRALPAYWYPLYVFVRRRGRSPHDAPGSDPSILFLHFLERRALTYVDRSKGRIRSFLLGFLRKHRFGRGANKRARLLMTFISMGVAVCMVE